MGMPSRLAAAFASRKSSAAGSCSWGRQSPAWCALTRAFREKRPPGNPLLRKGVQPPWLEPFNKGRKKGSRNKPRPKEPELIELRFLELTPSDEALMASPPTPEETEELICHFRDIRRQRDRWLKYVRRYQPWRLALAGRGLPRR